MKKSLLLPILLLAACGRGDAPAEPDNGSAPAAAGKSDAATAPAATGERLTGLYEGGQGEQKNQLCIVEKGQDVQFGLIVWGGNQHSCSGAGQAVRKGAVLTLKMTGDEACTVEASLKDGVVSLPATLPEGCAYYCGARASLANARFARAGSTRDDALKATDIAGDPLCG